MFASHPRNFPASSTDVERAFSHGGLTVSKRRHALSDKSVRAATVLSSWVKIPGIVADDACIKLFNEKSKRTGKSKATVMAEKDVSNDSEAVQHVS